MKDDVLEEIQTQQTTDRTLRRKIVADNLEPLDPDAKGLNRRENGSISGRAGFTQSGME